MSDLREFIRGLREVKRGLKEVTRGLSKAPSNRLRPHVTSCDLF